MLTEKIVEVKGKRIGDLKNPLICTPITGADEELLFAELDQILDKNPDLIEWRADFFKSISDKEYVIKVTHKLKNKVGDIPLLFTIRSSKEGGEPITLNDDEKIQLYSAVCESKNVDIIDFEICNTEEEINQVRQAAHDHGVKVILSHHNFQLTPSIEMMFERLQQAERYGADVAKIAVMPNGLEDVLSLLSVTLQAKNNLNIPLISISMGEYGYLTRMFGWVFGSAFTFAIGQNSSAPGQIPIEDLKKLIEITKKTIGD